MLQKGHLHVRGIGVSFMETQPNAPYFSFFIYHNRALDDIRSDLLIVEELVVDNIVRLHISLIY